MAQMLLLECGARLSKAHPLEGLPQIQFSAAFSVLRDKNRASNAETIGESHRSGTLFFRSLGDNPSLLLHETENKASNRDYTHLSA